MTTALTSNSEAPIVSVRSLLDIRRTHPRYKDIDPETRKAWLMDKIVYCNALNHMKPDANFIKVDTAALDEAMLHDRDIADLTAPEISFAMFHGTIGEYGEYYGLTPKTFVGFFREYMKTDVKYCATQDEKKAAEPERGSWVLERMEHHRQLVEKERAEAEVQEEADEALSGWKKSITEIIKHQ